MLKQEQGTKWGVGREISRRVSLWNRIKGMWNGWESGESGDSEYEKLEEVLLQSVWMNWYTESCGQLCLLLFTVNPTVLCYFCSFY